MDEFQNHRRGAFRRKVSSQKSAAMPALLLSGRRFTPSPLPSVTTRSTAMESASPSKRWNSLPRFIPASPGLFDHSMKGRDQTARTYRAWVERDETKLNSLNEPYTALRARAYMVRTPGKPIVDCGN